MEAVALLQRVTAKFDARESSPELDRARRLLRPRGPKVSPNRGAVRRIALTRGGRPTRDKRHALHA
jgi:hypothetical protein